MALDNFFLRFSTWPLLLMITSCSKVVFSMVIEPKVVWSMFGFILLLLLHGWHVVLKVMLGLLYECDFWKWLLSYYILGEWEFALFYFARRAALIRNPSYLCNRVHDSLQE